jgi:hypothetical protein
MRRTSFSPRKLLRVVCQYSRDSIFDITPSLKTFEGRIPDLNNPKAGVVVLVKVDVDGEMGVDVTHLVLEALGDTNDHVVDERTDGTESGDVLAGTVVHLDLDGGGIGLLEGDGQVTKVLLEGATGTLNGDLAGLDRDLDCTEVPLVVVLLDFAHSLRPIVPPYIVVFDIVLHQNLSHSSHGRNGWNFGDNAPPSGTFRSSSE